MTYENLAPPSQVEEKMYQLPGNGHTSVLVLTSSGHKHGTVIHILFAVSSNWLCPLLRIVSTSSLLIYNLFYLETSIPSAAFVIWYDLYFNGWNSFVTLFICTLHKVHTHISLWEVYFICNLTAVVDSSWNMMTQDSLCDGYFVCNLSVVVESSWNLMAYGDTHEGKWRGNWRM